jgi:hypothetical protein
MRVEKRGCERVHDCVWLGAVGECGRSCNILATNLATQGDLILVGDLMMSTSLLQYRAADSSVEELAGMQPPAIPVPSAHPPLPFP